MNLQKALEMIAPFSGLPHYDVAVAELYVADGRGKKPLREAAYRIRDAFVAYEYAVNYGKPDEEVYA
ncbi:hypothetical protein ABZ725_42065 [Streptomyces sp. NPDC006872]|uniref:hypothetical protein n=1 Tax=Streptomyces sp. NPDC006872 TaxID=3155720 RepID=UPI003406E71F